MMMTKMILSAWLALALCASLRAGAGEDEKLLFGFEKEECERAAGTFRGKNAFSESGNGTLLLRPPQIAQNPAANAGIVPMEMVQGDVTQGQYALRAPNSGYLKQFGVHYFYFLPDKDFMGLAVDPRVNLRLPEVFNTCHWYAGVFPADWSGYDLLRMDVKVIHDRPVTLIMEIEDAMVEPPVSLTYGDIKPDAWVTLELDLGKAVEERKLDLKTMSNIFLRFDGRKDLVELSARAAARAEGSVLQRAAVCLDNIRLARRGAACKLPAVQGERSAYTRELPRAYAAEIVWNKEGNPGVVAAKAPIPKPLKREAAAEEVALSAPANIDILPLLQKGFAAKNAEKGVTAENLHQFVVLKAVTAADGKALLICFAAPALGNSLRLDKPYNLYSFGPLAAVVTTDGGRTWGGLDGPGEAPSFLHKGRKAWHGTVFDAGADVMGLHDDGCLTFRNSYEDYPGDRIFLWRTIYTAEGWKRSPELFVSGDPRWCAHAAQNVLQLPSGRIWCMSSVRGRDGKTLAWAKYSDDEGLTWHSWRGDGFVSTVPLLQGEVRGELFPHGEHVGMIAEKGQWFLFDGKEWTSPGASPVKVPVEAVGLGREVFAIDQKGPLAWYDGAAWKALELPGREEFPRFYDPGVKQNPGSVEWTAQQHFTVCGETVVFVEPDKTGKKLLCWRRPKGGAWAGPQELASEETPIADVVAPRYGQAGFIPVAYNCWNDEARKSVAGGSNPRQGGRELKPWIKVLKVAAQ